MDDSDRDDSDRDDADWKNTLIRVYLFVCGRWSSGLCAVAQRQSNNSNPDFTDEEVLTIYLFGLIRKRETIKDIHEYAEDHFPEWFPDLPSYGGYVQRLNRLSAAFAPLTEAAIAEVDDGELIETLRIADSFPVMMAKEKRSSQAKVAPQIADKGYCSSKDTFCHGVKLSRSQTARGGTEATGDDASSKPGRPDGRIKKRFAGSPPSASCLSGWRARMESSMGTKPTWTSHFENGSPKSKT